MKFLLVLLVCLVVAASCERTAEEKKFFRKWMAEFEKSYKNHNEEVAAMENVLKHKSEVDAHNKLFSQGKVSFERGLNEYSDLTLEEKRTQVFGVAPDNEKSKREINVLPEGITEGPKSVNWTAEGLVSPAKRQKSCGACWAFAAAGVIEGVARRTKPKLEVSEQNLLDCAHNLGCAKGQGGWPKVAINYVKDNGIGSDEDYPYDGYKRPCEYNKTMEVATIKKSYHVKVDDEDKIKNVVAKFGPTSIGICADGALMDLTGDTVYDSSDCCKNKIGGHAVLIVGYGTNPKQGDYWVVKNSWGPNWGVNGFGKMKRGVNICGVLENHIQFAE